MCINLPKYTKYKEKEKLNKFKKKNYQKETF